MTSNRSISKIIWLFVGTLIVLPRLLRLAAPQVHIEDPNYIYGAFLIMKGMVPFADFAQVNPPLLESLIAVLYSIFNVTYRIPEIMSAIAYCVTAIILVRLGERFYSAAAGIAAAMFYSWHFLVFRYHVFERETFATLAIFLALDLMTRKKSDKSSFLSAGLLMGFGFGCKQTAIVSFAVILVFLGFVRKEWRRAFHLLCGFAFFAGLISVGYSLAFGRLYMDQIFWFHFIKGFVAPWYIKAYWTWGELGFMVPPMLAGLWFLRRLQSDWNWLWPAMIAADLVFFWVVSGAFWPHYLLSTLPAAALLSGMFLAGVMEFLQRKTKKKDDHLETTNSNNLRGNWSVLASLMTILIGVLGAQLYLPKGLVGTGSTEHYGFSGISRTEISEVGKAIRDNTAEDDWIISDPFIGLEAQRIKVVRFKDNWGLILWMQQMMERGEYRDAVRTLSKLPFGEIRMKSHRYWMPLVETAFAMNKVGAVQPNYELPLDDAFLLSKNMHIVYQSDHYTIWAKER
ncbi:MAG: glycosyltransferase family 39 protein [bacterium]